MFLMLGILVAVNEAGDGGIWDSIAPYLPPTGLTAGGLLATFFILLSRGLIITKGHHEEVLKANIDANAETLVKVNEANSAVVDNLKIAQTELIKVMTTNNQKTEIDRDYYRNGYELQRERSDALQGKVMDEILPILGVNVAVLKALPKSEGGE